MEVVPDLEMANVAWRRSLLYSHCGLAEWGRCVIRLGFFKKLVLTGVRIGLM